jgi:hypothetical protein
MWRNRVWIKREREAKPAGATIAENYFLLREEEIFFLHLRASLQKQLACTTRSCKQVACKQIACGTEWLKFLKLIYFFWEQVQYSTYSTVTIHNGMPLLQKNVRYGVLPVDYEYRYRTGASRHPFVVVSCHVICISPSIPVTTLYHQRRRDKQPGPVVGGESASSTTRVFLFPALSTLTAAAVDSDKDQRESEYLAWRPNTNRDHFHDDTTLLVVLNSCSCDCR